jgi:protein-S-isoprenylcysteine O-methyltransferase Ste14
MFGRITSFFYGIFCYLVFLATFLYAIGFIGNFGVPKSIDSSPQLPFSYALLINCALLGLFAVQHSVMARQWFKAVWTEIVPPQIERSTYVLFSSLALIFLFWLWEPMGGVIWSVENTAGRAAIYALYAFGWLTVLVATFLINHFDLFGLRQVWLHLRGRAYTPLGFRTPGPYRYVRHPLYVGWLLVCNPYHRLHSGSDSIRGTGPGSISCRVCRVSPARTDARAQWLLVAITTHHRVKDARA